LLVYQIIKIINPFILTYGFLCRIITVQSSPDTEGSSLTITEEGGGGGGVGPSLTSTSGTDSGVNLYILAGHEAMQL
jgi:hypothetical protein